MKKKKVLRNITIIISILILLATICIYLKMNKTFNGIIESKASYENASRLMLSGFYFGTLISSIMLLIIIWIKYILICISMKVYGKYIGWKRNLLLCLLILIIFILFTKSINLAVLLLEVILQLLLSS